MKKAITLSLIGLTVGGFANSESVSLSQKENSPHHFFIGPDIFWAHRIDKSKRKEPTSWTKIKTEGLLYGLKAGYEYLEPDSIYAGIEGLYSYGKAGTKVNYYTSEDVYHFSKHMNVTFANAEGRIGYTFQPAAHLLFTPFLGIGGYHIKTHSYFDIIQKWLYAAGGLRFNYSFNPCFDLGLNLKAIRSFYGKNLVKGHGMHLEVKSNDDAWGYEIALPLTFNIDEKNLWDIQLQPYFLKLDLDDNEKIVGGRLLLNHRF